MKKHLFSLILLLSMLFFSCKKDAVQESLEATNQSVAAAEVSCTYALGDNNTTPNVALTVITGSPASNATLQSYDLNPAGFLPPTIVTGTVSAYQSVSLGLPYGSSATFLQAWCLFENVATPSYNSLLSNWSGSNFRFNISQGTDVVAPNGSTYTLYQNLIGFEVFKNINGHWMPIQNTTYKHTFEPSYMLKNPILADSFYVTEYYPNMVLMALTGDIYKDQVPLPAADETTDGDYLVKFKVNVRSQDGCYAFKEEDHNNNDFVVKGNRVGNTFTLTNAVASIAPVTNLVGTYSGKGRTKGVALDWDCPYHVPFWIEHTFTVYRDGVKIAEGLLESNYFDKVQGAYRGATYSVEINLPSIGVSEKTNVYVPK